MTMRRVFSGFMCFSLIWLAEQRVEAAENLECVTSGFSETEHKLIESEVGGLDERFYTSPGPSQAVLVAIRSRVQECRQANGWSDEAAQLAALYAGPSLYERRLFDMLPLTADQKLRLESNYRAADSAELVSWTYSTIRGKSTPAEGGALMWKLIGTRDVGDRIILAQRFGGWLVTRVIADDAARRFAQTQ
jgi:hypothetical protein